MPRRARNYDTIEDAAEALSRGNPVRNFPEEYVVEAMTADQHFRYEVYGEREAHINYALRHPDYRTLKFLLDQGANPNIIIIPAQYSSYGRDMSFLDICVLGAWGYRKDINLASLLLRYKKTDINFSLGSDTLVRESALAGDSEMTDLLLSSGAKYSTEDASYLNLDKSNISNVKRFGKRWRAASSRPFSAGHLSHQNTRFGEDDESSWETLKTVRDLRKTVGRSGLEDYYDAAAERGDKYLDADVTVPLVRPRNENRLFSPKRKRKTSPKRKRKTSPKRKRKTSPKRKRKTSPKRKRK